MPDDYGGGVEERRSQDSSDGMLDAVARPGSRARRRRWLRLALVASDLVALVVAGILATYVRFGDFGVAASLENTDAGLAFTELSLMVVPIWMAFLWAEGLYDLERSSWGTAEFTRVARALSWASSGSSSSPTSSSSLAFRAPGCFCTGYLRRLHRWSGAF